jgi:site-specific recombinase
MSLPYTLAIDGALRGFLAPDGTPGALFAALFDRIRPRRPENDAEARERYRAMVESLEANPSYRAAVRGRFFALFSHHRQTAFFVDSGILPNTGFFSELSRQLVERILPDVPDEWSLHDVIRMVFHGRKDHVWLSAIPPELSRRFWGCLRPSPETGDEALRSVVDQMLEALVVLAHRVSAMGAEPELTRLSPDLLRHESPFFALAAETQRFADAYRRSLDDPGAPCEDERQALVLVDQCREVLRRVRRTALSRGTSLRLTYVLRRAWQSLERIESLAHVVAARFRPDSAEAALTHWNALIGTAIRAENERRGIRRQFSRLAGILALRVTDNAAQTGEHYIAANRADYLAMWRSAMGAGLIIGVLALAKILAAKLGWPPLDQAFVYSMNYALGFVLIYLLGLTIATKQPAMTAQTLAAAIAEMDAAKGDLGKLVDLVTAVGRTQLAAIFGNVTIAFPVALALGWGLGHAAGHPFIDAAKAAHLLDELDPLRSLAVPHAAVAGVCLFLSGLISGYFDNLAVHDRIPERVARLPWLRRLAGAARAERLGEFARHNLGGLAGNFFFGIMLGSIGTVASLFGLPIDIRHIAFASANLGYALVALEFAVPWQTVLWCSIGVALIGLTNLGVSFALALWVALKARGVAFGRTRELLRLLARELVARPGRFVLPPSDSRPADA